MRALLYLQNGISIFGGSKFIIIMDKISEILEAVEETFAENAILQDPEFIKRENIRITDSEEGVLIETNIGVARLVASLLLVETRLPQDIKLVFWPGNLLITPLEDETAGH